ncbi:uncharacterized protein TRIVIDRAFT_227322 [Trichoderma virens Gv29-8]|uniref:Uncharacterized protein n=1 Tax=Hypocrea virens (strain Gv29-8 / FGSC 10586) TaxID=413071 RepID=G9N935_HYPVG|nr:uncharacterized protein TRIVIDRAFT_227322 [Trichoderma virens Gv29-8]EHK16457.1 hypothetical protein TRIVIDRAFT_227322 [Trichoderma virens Gv29-8]
MDDVYVHQITDDDVRQAPILANDQAPRVNIVSGKQNIFFFKLPFDQGSYATVEFYITPFRHADIEHTLFKVKAIYTPSDNNIRLDQVIEAAQLIYDTYINVIRLELDGDILKCIPREAVGTFPSTPSTPSLSDACNKITTRVSTRSIPLDGSDSEVGSEGMGRDVSEPGHARITRKQDRGRNKPEPIAKGLVKRIQKGQMNRVKSGQEVNDDHAAFKFLVPHDGNNYDLNQIMNALLEMETRYRKDKDNGKWWTPWFFRCCLQMVIEEVLPWNKHPHRKHKPFQGAKAANLIVDKLLKSDESGSKLSKPSELTSKGIERVSDLVAKDLHGQIPTLTPSSLIPFPGLWLSMLFPTVQ